MLIGDSVTYEGRAHLVAGFTLVSVTPALIQLRDVQTGALAWVEQRLGAGSSCKNLPRLLGMPQQPHLLEPKHCALDQRLVLAHDAERT